GKTEPTIRSNLSTPSYELAAARLIRAFWRRCVLCPGSRHLARLRARGKFVGIVEWFEPRVLVSPFDGPREKAVREPWVLGEARSVEIATDHFSLYRALGLVFAVVAVSGDDRSERLRAGAEVRPPRVVLEPNERSVGRIHQQIAHEALPAGASGHVENAQPWYRGADLRHVLVSEELIAAADREDRGAALDGLPQARAVLAHQIGADDVLPLILAAAEEPHVRPLRVGPLANGVGAHLDADAPPFRALGERDDVAAVAVDVHQVGIEVRDPQIHEGQSSQNGTVAPARARTARSACIAVYVASTTTSRPSGASVVARSIAAAQSSTTSRRSFASPAYLKRSARSRPRSPVMTACSTDGARASKSASQIHDTSRPSASRSLRAARRRGVRPVSTSAPIAALNPAGFFTRTRRRVRPLCSIVSSRPKAGRKLASARIAS